MSLPKLLVLISFLYLSGCTLTPPMPVASYSDDRPYEEVRRLMYVQAKKCWAKRPGFFSDGVDISAYFRSDDPKLFVIYGRRYAYDIGHVETFVRIEVHEIDAGKALVKVSEGEFTIGEVKNYAADVSGWFEGNYACINH